MCQAVDSRNPFLTSLLVCVGIILSLIAASVSSPWSVTLHLADGVASVVIGLLVLKSAVELLIEMFKPEGETQSVSHFMGKAQERMRSKVLAEWITSQLADRPVTRAELHERFLEQFCRNTPKIMGLSGMGYRPETAEDLDRKLDELEQAGCLRRTGDRSELSG